MEKAIISEELFCEVMECQMIHHLSRNEKDIFFGWDDTNTFNINIHELSHKCKLWAKGKSYNLKETSHCIELKEMMSNKDVKYFEGMYDSFSPLLVFKACQWIYEKINK